MRFHVINQRPFDEGGHGELVVGERSDTGEPVVKKFLREHTLQSARRAFRREIEVLRRGLPGMMPLLDWDAEAEHPYYVMPYLSQGNLAKYAGRLTDVQLQGVAWELATTLANVHSVFQLHGDIKPDNVLVTNDGHLQVADPLGAGTVLTMLFSQNRGGTPGYLAPEIRAGRSISRATDVFSYGATLHHLKTGRRPTDGSVFTLAPKQSRESPKISELIAACCQTNPRLRPTFQEVVRMLNGESWTGIQAERKNRESLAFVGLLAVGALALSAASRRTAGR